MARAWRRRRARARLFRRAIEPEAGHHRSRASVGSAAPPPPHPQVAVLALLERQPRRAGMGRRPPRLRRFPSRPLQLGREQALLGAHRVPSRLRPSRGPLHRRRVRLDGLIDRERHAQARLQARRRLLAHDRAARHSARPDPRRKPDLGRPAFPPGRQTLCQALPSDPPARGRHTFWICLDQLERHDARPGLLCRPSLPTHTIIPRQHSDHQYPCRS